MTDHNDIVANEIVVNFKRGRPRDEPRIPSRAGRSRSGEEGALNPRIRRGKLSRPPKKANA